MNTKKGSYESHGIGDDYYAIQPYLEITHTEKVYLCTTSILCNKLSFLVHPDNIIEIVNDNK